MRKDVVFLRKLARFILECLRGSCYGGYNGEEAFQRAMTQQVYTEKTPARPEQKDSWTIPDSVKELLTEDQKTRYEARKHEFKSPTVQWSELAPTVAPTEVQRPRVPPPPPKEPPPVVNVRPPPGQPPRPPTAAPTQPPDRGRTQSTWRPRRQVTDQTVTRDRSRSRTRIEEDDPFGAGIRSRLAVLALSGTGVSSCWLALRLAMFVISTSLDESRESTR